MLLLIASVLVEETRTSAFYLINKLWQQCLAQLYTNSLQASEAE